MHRTSAVLAGFAVLLAATALSAAPAAAGAATSGATPAGAAAIGKRLAVLNGSGANRYFGAAVAMSGTTAVVGDGATVEPVTGRAYVFTKARAGWRQAANLKQAGAATSGFGSSVAISGGTVVVGAPDAASFAGRAYVFTKTAAGWKQTAVLKEQDPVSGGNDEFGTSVAVSGTTIVVGAPGHQHGNGFGEAYVFAKTPAGWKRTAELKEAGASDNGFGASVAVSGTTTVIGAPDAATFAGRAFVFARTASGWKQAAALKGPAGGSGVGGSGALFGHSVAISGTTVAVGEPQRNSPGFSGRVYVFAAAAHGWKQAAALKDGGTLTELGRWVAVSGGILVANRGLTGAFVFVRKAGRWKPVATLKHPGDGGSAVAVAGSLALVGVQGSAQRGHAYIFQA